MPVGDASIVVADSSPHQKGAVEACEYLLGVQIESRERERIKRYPLSSSQPAAGRLVVQTRHDLM